MSDGRMRIDGYPNDSEAAAGYMTSVGFLRSWMHQALKALDEGDPERAATILRESMTKHDARELERVKKLVPHFRTLGLELDPEGGWRAIR